MSRVRRQAPRGLRGAQFIQRSLTTVAGRETGVVQPRETCRRPTQTARHVGGGERLAAAAPTWGGAGPATQYRSVR